MGRTQEFLFVFFFASCFLVSSSQLTVCTQADIVFLVDTSWSIGQENFQQIRSFIITLVSSFDIGQDKVRVGLVQFSTAPRTEFLLSSFKTKEEVLGKIMSVPYSGGGTYTGLGLQFLLNEHFVARSGSRATEGVPQIAVVITDGKSQDDAEKHALNLKRKGVRVYAIGIKDAVVEELREIASKPHYRHVYNVYDFSALRGISEDFLKILCGSVEDTKQQVSQVPSECLDEQLAFDMVFLVDSSSSIGTRDFQELKTFMRTFVADLDIDARKVQIGLAQFSTDPHQEFLFGGYADKADLIRKIGSLPYQTGGTFMGKAMNFLKDNYFTRAGGSRIGQKVPQIVVVVTDGDSSDDIKGPAGQLRQQGIIIFAIGVGVTNSTELKAIANSPPERFVLNIENYQALQGLTTTMMETVCILMRDQGKAIAPKFVDVFVLVDSSAQTAKEKEQIRALLIQLAVQLKVGDGSHKMALAQFGDTVVKEFLFNDYKDTKTVRELISRFESRLNGERRLGKAIDFVHTHYLNYASGSRIARGYRQYLLVLRAGDSYDSVVRATETMKTEDVTIIDITLQADLLLLSPKTPSFHVQQEVIDVFSDIQTKILEKEVHNVTGDCRSAQVADIVFIVDESGSITTENFDRVKLFLHRIISGLVVNSDSVRIGMVLYHSQPKAEFYLDTFHSKNEILNYIKIIPYRGGGTSTGAALKFAKESLFVKTRGSRKALGVKQIAIVITDGESQDDVGPSASALRRSGVSVYALGVKDASVDELKKIASHPEEQFLFNVESFQMLTSLEKILRKSLCKTVVDRRFDKNAKYRLKQGCVNTEEADIFFLLDHSGSTQDFEDMKNFILGFLPLFNIGPNQVRVGVMNALVYPLLHFDLSSHKSKVLLEAAVKKIVRPRESAGSHRVGKSLEQMATIFQQARESRPHKVQEILIVITDQESGDQVEEPAVVLRNSGVSIYSIGVRDAKQEELLKMASDATKMFYVTNYDALSALKSQVVTDICSQEACKNKIADVMFLIDGSRSIYGPDFTSMKNFITAFVNISDFGEDNVHVGVVQFSDDPQVHFPLNKYYDRVEIVEAINGIQQLEEQTYTGKALQAISVYFDASEGGRSGVPQFLIVITDGEAHDAVAIPAKAIRNKGVTIYSIGVGTHINTTQLWEISGTEDKVYVKRDFDALQSLQKELHFKICTPATDCPVTQLADVIFHVQCKSGIRLQDFERIRNFLVSLVNSTQIGDNLIRFGVIIYSDTPDRIYLNQYHNKRDVLGAIRTLKTPKGNSYIAKALGQTLGYFDEANGGRQKLGVPQMLFVITDGRAADRNDLQAQAKKFEDRHVNVFGIGVAGDPSSELEIITKNKNQVFMVDSYQGLQNLQANISSVLCYTTKPDCQMKVQDLVFLVHSSAGPNEDPWDALMSYLLSIVARLRISPDLFRIGLAQFSNIYQEQFDIGKYANEESLKLAIRQLKPIKGPAFIGNALHNVVNFFQESKGSRKQSSVPKTLVLITDGISLDGVQEAAEKLRSLKINVFVIGIGTVSQQQLSHIAGSPDRFYRVQNYHSLTQTTTTFVDALCTTPPSDLKSCTVDIGIGFDNSRTSSSSSSIFRDQKKLESYLPEIIRSVSVVHNLCCISQPILNNNVGFRLVSAGGQMLNDYSFEKYNEGVVNKVMRLQTTQPLKFNTQLLGSFEKKFEASNSFVKILIIFTDGLDEPVENLLLASRSLRTKVQALLIVALDGIKSTSDLQRLEFGRGFRYSQLLSIDMQNVASAMQMEIDAVASRVCCGVSCKCTGQQGASGGLGSPGIKGLPGMKGLSGFPGEEGGVGERGLSGLNGTRGFQGCSGRRGIKGGRGYNGKSGDGGEDGLDGINGEQGNYGVAGTAGPRGDAGSPGVTGLTGVPGVKGERGLRGDPGNSGLDNNSQGPRGESGNPGRQGEPGPDGSPGTLGDSGRPGSNGRRGSAGLPGSRGPPGTPGLEGIPGASGPLGPSGPNGAVGQKGFLGLPGPQGSPGSPGRTGSKGSLGSRGQKGQPGDPGDKGAVGPSGPRGMPGSDGEDGYGFQGTKGQKGDVGFPGYSGLQGEHGLSGRKGGPGPKGNRGAAGNAGQPGQPGGPGTEGVTGHRGQRGRPGTRQMSDCQLISYVRDNCMCCRDNIKCPVYPTDLVIGLDMSEDVNPQVFERMRTAVLTLLDSISIAESSCPTGARVAVVSFSSHTKYLIRFFDYHRKRQLIEAVKSLALERTSNRRNLGGAMRFVGRNVLKRVRKGVLMRKVVLFFTNGESQDSTSLTTAVLEYKALNIKFGVIAMKNTPSIKNALEADETKSFVMTVLGRAQEQNASLSRIHSCVLCFDPCRPARDCEGTNLESFPEDLDLDLAVIVDGSRSIQADQYEGVKDVLSGVLDQINVSNQPSKADQKARVAFYQQSSTYSEVQFGVKEIFGFGQFTNRDLMKRNIYLELKQTSGLSTLSQAMEYSVMQGILTASKGRKNKMVLVIVSAETTYRVQEKMDFISKVAKCEGVILFALTVGDHINMTLVEELVSFPSEQHIVHLGHLKHGELDYTLRFLRGFFRILSRNVNSYPPPSLQCGNVQQDSGQRLVYTAAERTIHRVPVETTSHKLTVKDHVFLKKSEEQHSEHGDSLVLISSDYPGQCLLSSDIGTVCADYVQMWYYNDAVRACLLFWYGGCGGNGNRFNTEKECLQTCGKTPEPLLKPKVETVEYQDACLMKQEVGPCSEYVLSWYYDTLQNECAHFWYGGCGGNKNRFETQKECATRCVRQI